MLPRDLSPASFRGVRFLVPSDTAEEGRNAIHHNYPDAGFRYIEDNGLHAPEFKISAVLAGDNLPAKYKALRAALNRPGPGLLRHPWYGAQHVMVDGKFRVKRDDRDAGVLEIEIPFAVTGPPSFPGVVGGIPAYVTSLATDLLQNLYDSFVERYAPPFTAASANAVASVIEDVADVIDSRFSDASTAGAHLAAGAVRAAMSGTTLADGVVRCIRETVFESDVAADTIVEGYAAVADIAGAICDTAATAQVDTGDRVARAAAMASFGEMIEVAAFLAMCEGIVGRGYATSDEAEADEARLAAIFERIQQRGWGGDVHRLAETVFVAATEVLGRVSVRKPRLVETRLTQPIPLSVICYELYESDAHLDVLVGLNVDQPPVLVAETAVVLMERSGGA